MKIRFLGQSGYILKTENSEIIIDPYLSDSVEKIKENLVYLTELNKKRLETDNISAILVRTC